MTTTVSLRFLDRIALASVLPERSNIDTLLRIEDIRRKVEITAEEKTLSSMRQDPQGNVVWNNAADSPKRLQELSSGSCRKRRHIPQVRFWMFPAEDKGMPE